MMTPSNDLINQVLNQGPSQNSIYIILSHMMGEKQNAAVIQGCLKALDLYPDDIRLRQLLAEAYLQLGFIGQAETELNLVIERISGLTGSYKTLAKLYLGQKRMGEAQRLLQLYCLHQPDDMEAVGLLAALPAEEAKPEAEPEEGPEEVSEADVLVQLATPTLAEIYFKQGQLQEAIRTYEKVVARNPHDERSMLRLNGLKGAAQGPAATKEGVAGPSPKETNQRMISVLEGWLTRIRELKRGRA
jgi:tetratricopeptide (TPR) repeat protein